MMVETKTVPVRSAQEIVQQTEDIAALLMMKVYQRSARVPEITYRDSEDPRAKRCWEVACQMQEMLTDTDPENAVAELEGEEQEAKFSEPENTGYLVIQEVGSSCELYAKGFDDLDQAQEYRQVAADDGSYRTSEPLKVPVSFLKNPVFMELVSGIAEAVVNIDHS